MVKFYGEDLSKDQLKVQLDILAANLPVMTERNDLPSLLSQSKAMSHAQRSLLHHVCTVTALILVMPATNVVSEWLFSTLRRVKPNLRSTMSQVRLNTIMTLHIHKELTDKLDLLEIGNEFMAASNHRQQTLANFFLLIIKCNISFSCHL